MKLSWKDIFNTSHKQYGWIAEGAQAAANAGYQYYNWSGIIFKIEGKEHSKVCLESDLSLYEVEPSFEVVTKTIILPTDEATSVWLSKGGNLGSAKMGEQFMIPHPKLGKNQHIYITTNEAIKESEWCFEKHEEYDCDLIRYPDSVDNKFSWFLRRMNMNCAANDPEAIKVVQSTDLSLNLPYPENIKSIIKDHNNSKQTIY